MATAICLLDSKNSEYINLLGQIVFIIIIYIIIYEHSLVLHKHARMWVRDHVSISHKNLN
jgi:hypothetical protein